LLVAIALPGIPAVPAAIRRRSGAAGDRSIVRRSSRAGRPSRLRTGHRRSPRHPMPARPGHPTAVLDQEAQLVGRGMVSARLRTRSILGALDSLALDVLGE